MIKAVDKGIGKVIVGIDDNDIKTIWRLDLSQSYSESHLNIQGCSDLPKVKDALIAAVVRIKKAFTHQSDLQINDIWAPNTTNQWSSDQRSLI